MHASQLSNYRKNYGKLIETNLIFQGIIHNKYKHLFLGV